MTTKHLSIELSPEIDDRLARLARATSSTPVALAADAVASYVDTYEWQVGEIRAGLAEADAGNFAGPDEVRAVFDKWMRSSP